MNLDELKTVLLVLLSDEEEKINKFITDLGTFFVEKEGILGKKEADFVAALAAFKEKHKDLPALLDFIDVQIKDKQIKKIIKKIKDKIKSILTALQKRNAKNVLFFQQGLAKVIEDFTTNLIALNIQRNPPPEKEFVFEASSIFRDQRNKSNVFDPNTIRIGIKKIEQFARAGQVPIVQQAGEPHCYGGAPNHLNSVVIGHDRRLVFYVPHDESGDIIRLCAYIDPKTHNDAIDAVQERRGNIYWLIIKHQINRTYFTDFRRINKETLKDL